MARMSWITSGERDSAFSTVFWPRSMRRAISTSPSRVSSGTVPISRRYMRTGSLIFSPTPGGSSRSSSSSVSSSFLSNSIFGSSRISMPAPSSPASRSSSSAAVVQFGGKQFGDFVVKDVALLLASVHELLQPIEFVVECH